MSVVFPLEEIAENLKAEEGFSPSVYFDTRGIETIGYGRNVSKLGPGLRKEEAEMMLMNDINQTIKELDSNFEWFVTSKREVQIVLIEMCFQMGLPTLLRFRKFLAALEDEKLYEAAQEIENSRYYRQVPNRAKRYINRIINA